jgi:hypothetical protein
MVIRDGKHGIGFPYLDRSFPSAPVAAVVRRLPAERFSQGLPQ